MVKTNFAKIIFCTFYLLYSVCVVAITDDSSNYTAHGHIYKSRDNIDKLLDLDEYQGNVFYKDPFLTPAQSILRRKNTSLEKNIGTKVGLAYTTLFQHALNNNTDKNFSSGIIDLFGRWHFYKNNNLNSYLGFRVEAKHRFTSSAPKELQKDYNTLSHSTNSFNSYRGALVELWLSQELIKNSLVVRLGKINIFNILDSYAFSSDNFYYLNNIFSSHPAITSHTFNDNQSLGIVTKYTPDNKFYAIYGLADVNAQYDVSGFDSFFNDREYFHGIEIGYRNNIFEHYADNYHIFLWQSAASSKHDHRSDNGFSILLQKNLGNVIPFAKYSMNQGRAARFEKLFKTGFVVNNLFNKRFQSLGIAGAIGDSTVNSINREYVGEIYYKIKATSYLEVTPDYQVIKTKTANGRYNTTNVLGMRFRLATI